MKLLLLTARFPYHPGEQFLETEIPILAEIFENIVIVPIDIENEEDMSTPRRVPVNIDVLILRHHFNKKAKIKLALKTAGIVRSTKDIITAASQTKLYKTENLYALTRQYFIAALKAALIMQKVDMKEYNIIYSYWGAGIGLVLHFLKSRYGDKKIFASRLHSYDLYAERQNLKRLPFQKHLLKDCDMIAPCSMQGQQYLKTQYNELAKNVHYFHLGVAKQNYINRGSSDDILRIVTCSFIVPVKRLELLISALMKVSRKIQWSHIGDGQDKDKIMKLAAQLPKNVQPIFCGHLENADVLEYYREHPVDLFVNISSYEGVPVSIMEALSFGIETVATNVGGVSELVKPDFGILLDKEFLVEDLAAIIQNYKISEDRRIKAQQYQQKYFSSDNYQAFAAKLLEHFRKRYEN